MQYGGSCNLSLQRNYVDTEIYGGDLWIYQRGLLILKFTQDVRGP